MDADTIPSKDLTSKMIAGASPAPAHANPDAHAREDALAHAMSGQLINVAGIKIRQFSMADFALLRRVGSRFVSPENEVKDKSAAEALLLFFYIMDGERNLDELIDEVFSAEPVDIIKRAIKKGFSLTSGQDLTIASQQVGEYLRASRKTRVKPVPDEDRASKKKEGRATRRAGGSA